MFAEDYQAEKGGAKYTSQRFNIVLLNLFCAPYPFTTFALFWHPLQKQSLSVPAILILESREKQQQIKKTTVDYTSRLVNRNTLQKNKILNGFVTFTNLMIQPSHIVAPPISNRARTPV